MILGGACRINCRCFFGLGGTLSQGTGACTDQKSSPSATLIWDVMILTTYTNKSSFGRVLSNFFGWVFWGLPIVLGDGEVFFQIWMQESKNMYLKNTCSPQNDGHKVRVPSRSPLVRWPVHNGSKVSHFKMSPKKGKDKVNFSSMEVVLVWPLFINQSSPSSSSSSSSIQIPSLTSSYIKLPM